MEQVKYDVFISYRRESGTYQADALRANLENNHCSVFMDTRKMGSGDFTKKLEKKIREYSNFVVVISKDCFPHQKKSKDYFLYEIGQALRMGKNVIPIYYDGMEYKDIEEFLYGIEDFQLQNAITYHNDAPEGSINQIISFLKTKEEVLKERFESLSKERTTARKELVKLGAFKVENRCPVCNDTSHSVIMTYCPKCGYKFFDKLDESVAEDNELIQENERLEKHKEIWRNGHSDEIIIELRQQLEETKKLMHKSDIEHRQEEKKLIDKLQDSEAKRKELLEETNKLMYESDIEHRQEEKKLIDKLQDSEAKRKELEEYQAELEKQLETLKNQATVSVIGQETLEIPVNDKVSFKMIRVEGGSMGTFYIGETQVTQELWQALMGNNPSRFEGQKNPVETVSWYDICGKDGKGTDPNCFLYRLKQKTGKNFRLPTEAEWEYAAKGGNKSKDYIYAGSDDIDKVAWYWKNSGDNYLKGSDNDWDWSKIEKNRCKTHPVKQLSPNELGLYDMSGNVWEWCEDLYNPPISDRVLRGGSWRTNARYCRVSDRYYDGPGDGNGGSGFRLVLPQ